MGVGTPRASTSARAAARTSPERIHPTRHPRAPSPVIPAPLYPSFLRRQEPALPPPSPPIPNSSHQPPAPRILPFPNSSLPPTRGEVRWGVERRERPPAAEPPPAPLQSASTPPSFPRPLPVIPAQAGTRATFTVAPHPQFISPTPRPTHPPPSPIHPSPLPGGRLGGGCDAPSVDQRPSRRPHSLERIHNLVIPAQERRLGIGRELVRGFFDRADSG